MSRFLAFFFAAFLTLAAPLASAQTTAYLRLIEDVPLPQGYREAGEAVVFEGTAGRIVQTSIIGRAGREAARRFYLDALPVLGWSSAPEAGGDLIFNRGRERLSIVFSESQATAPNLSAVQFRLVTRPASLTPD